MNKVLRSKAQVARDKKALKTLKKSGLYTGKLDFRRAPTPYQKGQIRKYADVIAGKAAVVRPRDPGSYREHFAVKGDAVIVPRGKGEKIGLSKTGKITRTRRTRSGAQKRTIVPLRARKIKPGERRIGLPQPAPGKALVFYLPFRRGSGAGQVTQWKRYTHSNLIAFLHEYDLSPEIMSDWLRYVEIEELDAAYERQLDQLLSGEPTGEPSDPLPHTSSKFRRAKRKLRRDAMAAHAGGDEE
jgi:hypothetical protein